MSNETKSDYEYREAQCHYCKEWYTVPIGHYHAEGECLANQAKAKETE